MTKRAPTIFCSRPFLLFCFCLFSFTLSKAAPSVSEGKLATMAYYGIGGGQNYNLAFTHATAGSAAGENSAKIIQSLCLGMGRGVEQDIPRAIKLLQPLVAKSDPLACGAMAEVMSQGRLDMTWSDDFLNEFAEELKLVPAYRPKDREKYVEVAIETLSSQTDDPLACVITGELLAWYSNGRQSESKARTCFNRAWELGCSEAATEIGLLYSEGDPSQRSLDKAIGWYEQAAKAGSISANTNLFFYQSDNGVRKYNSESYSKLLATAVAAGDPTAMECLADALWKGDWLQRDAVEAWRLWEMAAARGDRSAMFSLSARLQQGSQDEKQQARAWHLLKLAFLRGGIQSVADVASGFLFGYSGAHLQPALGFEIASKAASAGFADACTVLGIAYERGIGTSKNIPKAAETYRLGIDRGSSSSSYQLGILYKCGLAGKADFAQAYSHFLKGAEIGYPAAISEKGKALLDGVGVEKDTEAGISCLRKAVDLGEATSLTYLGRAYEYGEGVEKDLPKAIEYFQKAAERGEEYGEYYLGQHYYLGTGVPHDVPTALRWLEPAAKAGVPEAQFLVGCCYSEGVGVAVDNVVATSWFRKSAELGYALGQYNFSQALLNGKGIQSNPEEGIKWLKAGASQGLDLAAINLGLEYVSGTNVTANPVEAARWFREASNRGNPIAANCLGYSYLIGNGVEQDWVEAYQWLALAMAQEKDVESKERATVNMKTLLPKMLKSEIAEGKERAAKFVPNAGASTP